MRKRLQAAGWILLFVVLFGAGVIGILQAVTTPIG